jgi:hypothetical protein
MGIRGSGEGSVGSQTYKTVASNGFEGPTLQRLLREYTYSDAYTASLADVPIVGLSVADGYNAVPVDHFGEGTALFSTESAVWNSATDGSIAAIRKIGAFQRSQPAGCPTTRWILLGYSQGAMAARWTFDAMPSRVASLYLVGDPFQLPNKPGNKGGGKNGTGLVRWNFSGDASKLDRYYNNRPADSVTLCHDNDVICDFGWPFKDATHLDYFTTAGEKRAEGRALAKMVSAAVTRGGGAGGTPKPAVRDVEIMFAIDTTGSMGSYISDAVDSARALGNQVLGVTPSSKVGLVEYRDHGDSFVSRSVVPLTRNVSAFESGLEGLDADEGGDTPEAVYSGMVKALGASWSPTAKHAVAVIGDAPAHDPEPVTGYTGAEIARMFAGTVAGRRLGRVATAAAAPDQPTSLVFGLSSDSELTDQLDMISETAGGNTYDIGDDGSVGELMSDVVEETEAAPVATLKVLPSVSGHDTVVSAADSYVSVGEPVFDLDLDGDGVFETAGAEPVQSLRLEPGSHTVGVQVTDAEGRVATATTTFTTASESEAFTPPSSTVHPLPGLRLDRRPAPAGKAFGLVVPRAAAAAGSSGYAILRRSGAPRLSGASISGSQPVAVGQRMMLPVPRRLTPGLYRIDVETSDGGYRAVPIRVQQPVSLSVTKPSKVKKRKAIRLKVGARALVGSVAGRVSVLSGKKSIGSGVLRKGATTIYTKGFRTKGRKLLLVKYVGSQKHAARVLRVYVRVR